MAENGVQLNKETFSCCICLELLKDPVTIPCGHSYCMKCINTHWDEENQRGIHSCPQCRKTFRPRPVLEKNTMLATLMEELKKTGLQAAPADHHYAGPEDVACDFCTGRKRKAVRSCLFCPASYCEKHLQPHYDVPSLRRHKLVEPTKDLQENICCHHGELMTMFCRTDLQTICFLCSVQEHKDHNIVSAAEEKTERQKELEGSQLTIQQSIQCRHKNVKLLQEDMRDLSDSADKTLERSWKILEALTRLIRNSNSVLNGQIRSQQETEKSQILELRKKLEQEISDLKRRDAELKQLLDTPDHTKFLHNYLSVSTQRESTHLPGINISSRRHFEHVLAVLIELKEEIQNGLEDTWGNISEIISLPNLLVPEPHPSTTLEFRSYKCDITLNPNTAFKSSILLYEDRRLSLVSQDVCYPDHPDRFTDWCQALSRESLSRRCYWEVVWRGRCRIAVAYKSISRSGDDSRFGQNDKSWALECDDTSCQLWHNGIRTHVPAPHIATRIGVYLDYKAGILSFYSCLFTMTLLRRIQTTFTEPLHAGFWTDNYVEIVPCRGNDLLLFN